MLKDLLRQLFSAALDPLLALAAAGFAWACHRAARWLSAKAQNEKVKGVIDRLDDAVTVGVQEVEQSIVKALKAASPDGKLTPQAASIAKQAAIESVKAHLGAAGMTSAQKVLGASDIEAVISSRVEAAVGSATK